MIVVWSLFYLIISNSYAASPVVFQSPYYGEVRSLDFFGKVAPDTSFRRTFGLGGGDLSELEWRTAFNNYLPEDFFTLEFLLKEEMGRSWGGGVDELKNSYSNLRYAFRVIAFSYLYEALNFLKMDLLKLNLSAKSCDFSQIQFNAQTEAMKRFVERVKASERYNNIVIPANHSFQQYRLSWTAGLSEKDHRLSQQAYQRQCAGAVDCLDKIEFLLSRECSLYQSMLEAIGNESDHFYGLGKSSLAYDLIVNSEMMALFPNGSGAHLMKQFQRLYFYKEISNFNWPEFMQQVFKEMTRDESLFANRSFEGRPFMIGVMKHFDDKGVKEFFLSGTPAPTPTVLLTPTPLATLPYIASKKAPPEKDKKQIVRVTPGPTPQVLVTPTPIKKSAFLVAKELRTQFDFKRSKIDMIKFKYDFIFSDKAREKLKHPLKLYMARDGLQEMKNKDKLGQKEMPFNLLFIKYMLDEEDHQALFNVQAVLGQKFFVVNDLDKADSNPVTYIELLNDETTNHLWQLFVLKNP